MATETMTRLSSAVRGDRTVRRSRDRLISYPPPLGPLISLVHTGPSDFGLLALGDSPLSQDVVTLPEASNLSAFSLIVTWNTKINCF